MYTQKRTESSCLRTRVEDLQRQHYFGPGTVGQAVSKPLQDGRLSNNDVFPRVNFEVVLHTFVS